MKLPIAAALVPVLLAGCARPAAVDSARASGTIAVEVKSWGHPVASWSIDAAGNGRRSVPEPGVHNAERIVTRGFAAGPAGFARIRALLAPARARAGNDLPCAQRLTDMHYGTVRWEGPRGTAALAFDSGCRDAPTRALVERIEQADAAVAAWAAAGPVVETRKTENP